MTMSGIPDYLETPRDPEHEAAMSRKDIVFGGRWYRVNRAGEVSVWVSAPVGRFPRWHLRALPRSSSVGRKVFRYSGWATPTEDRQMARYTVHFIASPECDTIRPETILATDSLADAEAAASETDAPYGAAIRRSEDGLVDYGHGFGVPVPEIDG